MQKLYKHVHQAPTGYFFRLTLPVAKVTAEERWADPQDAAFACDVFKLYLVKKYQLAGNTMWPSLPPVVFTAMLNDLGADRTSTDSLFDALSQSCRDFLLNSGTEELEQYVSARSTMQRVIQ